MSKRFELGIPKEDLPIIKKILDLDEDQKKFIHAKFKIYKPSKFDDDIKAVEEFKEYPEIFELIITLFRLFQRLQEEQMIKDIDEFISQISKSYIKQTESESDSVIDEKFQLMGEFFKEFFTTDTPFFYYEKAIKLLLERSKLIESTRIITDIRPVFKEEIIDSPNYSLITHNLRILYTKESGNRKKVYFALDHQDLLQLQSQIERALKKEEELQKLCQKTGLEIFKV